MFTNGSMDFIENLIVGSYPNGLRDKDERQRYFDNFVRIDMMSRTLQTWSKK